MTRGKTNPHQLKARKRHNLTMDEDVPLSVEETRNSTIRPWTQSKRWHSQLQRLQARPSRSELLLPVHYDFILHCGKSGSVILLGLMCEILVAIKKSPNTEASMNEIKMLCILNHSNIIQYKSHNYYESFIYLITELVETSLEDCIKEDVDNLKLVEDVLHGLNYLHSNNIVHGEVKHQNVVVDVNGRAKLIDFKKSHRVSAGDGSIREEIKKTGELVFYILSGGETYCVSDGDSSWNNKDITLDLIEWMTHPEPAEEKSLQDVLYHPIFWDDSRKLKYLQSVGNLPEHKTKKELNNKFKKKTWRSKVEQDFADVLKEMDDYKIHAGSGEAYPDDIWGLLRFIRNVYQHKVKEAPSIKFLSLFPDVFESVYLFAEEKGWNSEYRLCDK